MKELAQIQSQLKAPKSQRNSFGNYNYRSLEDILEAVKPLLEATHTALVISDEMVEVGGRIYVKATAELHTTFGLRTKENGEPFINTSTLIARGQAYAREAENKKGMDESQLTGATSSYARKYALNGLFAIDDTRDSDSTNTHGKEEKNTPVNTPTTQSDTQPMKISFGKK